MKSSPTPLWIALAALAVAVSINSFKHQVSANLYRIEDAIRSDTQSRLCTQLWEIGEDSPACDNITGKAPIIAEGEDA